MTSRFFLICCFLMISMLLVSGRLTEVGRNTTNAMVTQDARKCIECHADVHGNLVWAWEQSEHARQGVGCPDCHLASQSDPDAVGDHYNFTISPVVTPSDCGNCHEPQARSFLKSSHSKSARHLFNETAEKPHPLSLIGRIAAGTAAFQIGCQSCHGSKIEIDRASGRPEAESFPNYGMGRINPDGTAGTCAACHPRHDCSMSGLRDASTCGRCHRGPGHPQMEIWQESRHGAGFQAANARTDFSKPNLTLGKDGQILPNCVTCHLGGTSNDCAVQTHDPSERISWRNTGELSRKTSKWPDKRERMQGVCRQCHGTISVRQFFARYDKVVGAYNHKFALPSLRILKALETSGALSSGFMHEPIERIWFDMWYLHGRSLRMGAAMMGTSKVQWDGFNELSGKFYHEFIPEAEKLYPGIASEALAAEEHNWFTTPGVVNAELFRKWLNEQNDFYEKIDPSALIFEF